MRTLVNNDYFALLLRVVVGTVFVFASVEKIADPAAFAVSVSHYKLIGAPLTLIVATVLPWIELLAGLGLLFGILYRANAFLCSSMMLLFTVLVVIALLRGLDISCGCFTQDPAAARMGWGKALENTVLLLCSLLAYLSHGDRFTLERRIRAQR
jgi:uncharacterized membrane protein YphA (DoxX/SURF4 family)